ncbi:MAG: hypothetical protein QGG39_03610 [Candidatus Poribacteria bacterium]|nr:hypothetical protein [Candidatus Poribacteria bacterium]
MPVPLEREIPVKVEFSPNNFNAIYAITDHHAYRSLDYGQASYLGQSWQRLTEYLPALDKLTLLVAHAPPLAGSENASGLE